MTPADKLTFDDDLSAIDARETLWRTVLMIAVNEAVSGFGITGTDAEREVQINAARRYFTLHSADLAEVCNLAGLDPDAVRERVIAQIERAPSVSTLARSRQHCRSKVTTSHA